MGEARPGPVGTSTKLRREEEEEGKDMGNG
jgi:hypothetical protein